MVDNKQDLAHHYGLDICKVCRNTGWATEMSFFEKFIMSKLLEIKLKIFFHLNHENMAFNDHRRSPIGMMFTSR